LDHGRGDQKVQILKVRFEYGMDRIVETV